jgi:3,5-epimerase/4-reductase
MARCLVSMPRIVVFGPGYIGEKVAAFFPDAVLSTVRIDDVDQVEEALDEHQPEVVINCAGKAGKPNVDWCESHVGETFRSNTIGPLVLAEACVKRNLHLVHLGSGCIFYGPSPDPAGWREDDFANPSAVYTRSKYAADLGLTCYPNVAILRLRMPIDVEPVPKNLITKLVNYPKIIDVENSVTVVPDLLEAIRGVVEKKGTGIFHVVNEGTMKHRDLIALYQELVDPSHTNEWITNDDLVAQGLAVKGRSNCILQNTRLPELGIHMRPIHEALRDVMTQYAHNLRK